MYMRTGSPIAVWFRLQGKLLHLQQMPLLVWGVLGLVCQATTIVSV